MKIGVLSDTHNYLDPRIPILFAGVDHILHGGDIGRPAILLELEQIAPVTAVGGNTDDPGFRYSETEVVQLANHTFVLQHVVDPNKPADLLRSRIARAAADVVIFGHTHKPHCETRDGVLFFNPGYAGKPRFLLRRSAAILYCEGKDFRSEYIGL